MFFSAERSRIPRTQDFCSGTPTLNREGSSHNGSTTTCQCYPVEVLSWNAKLLWKISAQSLDTLSSFIWITKEEFSLNVGPRAKRSIPKCEIHVNFIKSVDSLRSHKTLILSCDASPCMVWVLCCLISWEKVNTL